MTSISGKNSSAQQNVGLTTSNRQTFSRISSSGQQSNSGNQARSLNSRPFSFQHRFNQEPKPELTGTVQKCRDAAVNLNSSITTLLAAANVRNNAAVQPALQSKVNQLRSALETLRSSVNALPDIDTDIEYQIQTINGLQRQLQLKNEFVVQTRKRDLADIIPTIGSIGSVDSKSNNDDGFDNTTYSAGYAAGSSTNATTGPLVTVPTINGNNQSTEFESTVDSNEPINRQQVGSEITPKLEGLFEIELSISQILFQETTDKGRNLHRLICLRCRSVVLTNSSAEMVSDMPMELPHIKVQTANKDTESISEWWKVNDLMVFENIGVTNSHDGRRYLCCADCDLGPIGIQIDNLYYLALDRLSA
ncbi:Guanine nucleotide exchange factor MSS4-like protein [Aphelenchoides besseyi]|nr:Guanine nucleotide exchange factor MSS4-like protein [Aphelenchoides besseyi]KAI6202356.1 Guanine nucleotide exchange factor MSS4-like protein [Aphelenchoides besseyi]